MEDFEKELKLDFLDEATQLLENTEQAFLQLENDLHNKELIDEIFRFAHNLKGTSRAVGFGVVAEFTHEVENLILKLKQEEIEITDHIVSVLLECNDHITTMIAELKENFDASFESSELVTKVQAAIDGNLESLTDNSTTPVETVALEETSEEDQNEQEIAPDLEQASFEVDEELINHELLAELEAMNSSGTETEASKTPSVPQTQEVAKQEDSLPGLNVFKGKENISKEESPKNNIADPTKPKLKEEKKIEKDESIRVSLSRVEALNNFVGELVILQSVLEQQKYIGIQDELAIKSIGQLSKLSKEIQEISMSLRMIPVKTTLQKMSRIVRDTSKTLGKKVNLTLKGEETEIDKTVLEHLADPLVHIVRNAVDHGLESTQERIEVGKDEKGQVVIEAYHEGNNLVIDVSDDGKGINPDIIRAKAIEKGVLDPNSSMNDYDVIQLIFHPGFSTKEEVSEVSGRGVGMDVVKTNIEKLSGDVRVITKLGQGSVFRIVLPLTMAIIDGMVIRVGTEKFVIPIAQVQESLKPNKKDIHYATGIGDCLNLRGKVLPVKKVSRLLKLNTEEKEVADQIVIIAKSKQGLIAVAVDDIIQQQQVVIKKLGKEIKDQKGFMGSSILGDGKPAFIVDIDDLCSKTTKKAKKIAA
ncbi:MAG: chemotaxis protein CheA [Bacteriovoracaceae bacterium]|jgi:two-component system chemotaxis sensor kinase CheA|nr:chemotaxis protein CheA [Bacteriovoracaceae bacterium]